jgi:hypothetical protein
MITLKAKTDIQRQMIEILETVYDQVDKSILWFNGVSESDLKRLYDVRDLCIVTKELVTYNSRSSVIILKVLLDELRACPVDITRIETKGLSSNEISEPIADIIAEVHYSIWQLESWLVNYEV